MAPKMLNCDRLICVLTPDGDLGRAVHTGVTRYVRRHSLPWRIITDMRLDMVCEMLRSGQPNLGGFPLPDVLIGFVGGGLAPEVLAAHPLPVVSCSVRTPDLPGLVRVLPDDDSIGVTAARYLVRRGFCQVVFWGGSSPVAERRFTACSMVCRNVGLLCHRYVPTDRPGIDIAVHFRGWIDSLQGDGRVAVFCHQDGTAAFVRGLCRTAGIAVPGELAILGVDDDRLLCTHEDPHLSSVVVPWWEIGEACARAAQVLLSGQRPESGTTVPSMGVVSRASTERCPVADEVVEKAIRMLHHRPQHAWTQAELAAAVGIPSRTLQRRWRYCGGSFSDELVGARLDAAEVLLRDEGMGVTRAGDHAGFNTRQTFYQAFRRRHGVGPNVWRRRSGRRRVATADRVP